MISGASSALAVIGLVYPVPIITAKLRSRAKILRSLLFIFSPLIGKIILDILC
jgi:hypothetical protein